MKTYNHSSAAIFIPSILFAMGFSSFAEAGTYCRTADIPLGEVVTDISRTSIFCDGKSYITQPIEYARPVCNVPSVPMPANYYIESKSIEAQCWDGSIHYNEIHVVDSNSNDSTIEVCYGDVPNAFKHGTSEFANSDGPHYDWYVSSLGARSCDTTSIHLTTRPRIANKIEPFSLNEKGAERVFRACKGSEIPPYAKRTSDFSRDRDCNVVASLGQSAEYTVSFDELCPTTVGEQKPYSRYTKAICPPPKPKPKPTEKCLKGTLYGNKGSNIKLYSVDKKSSIAASNGKLVMRSSSSQTWTLQDKNNDGEFGILNSAGAMFSNGKGDAVSVKKDVDFSERSRWIIKDANSDGIYQITSVDRYHGSLYRSTYVQTAEFNYKDESLWRVCEVK
ncbi:MULTISPECIES: hypothetical protein [unclassified Pseudoalteromonas]|jgi:hypothetical protein|uniref:hypothetical protein n=1 Tax=unclassified Pseudoalteromonas TaxID=194690 RepID=UPI001BA92DAB|nr:hypothetical protein [Pseudoalteromonas sp. M8]QUI68794.1 hypothetical protein GSF13_03025 [Pseudoalteromonas sp. M8]